MSNQAGMLSSKNFLVALAASVPTPQSSVYLSQQPGIMIDIDMYRFGGPHGRGKARPPPVLHRFSGFIAGTCLVFTSKSQSRCYLLSKSRHGRTRQAPLWWCGSCMKQFPSFLGQIKDCSILDAIHLNHTGATSIAE